MGTFPDRGSFVLKQVQELATKWGWAQFDLQENIKMVSFTNGPDRINVYYSRMTVATIIDHPVQGRNTMYRRGVTFTLLAKIFQDPRAHLGMGYHHRRVGR